MLWVHVLLNRKRAARLVEHHARDSEQPSLREVLDALLDATWSASEEDGLAGEVQRVVNSVMLTRLLELASSPEGATQVRAVAHEAIMDLRGRLGRLGGEDWAAHREYAALQIERYFENPVEFAGSNPVVAPPGSPIGSPGTH